MIVDDDPEFAASIAEIFEADGHGVTIAENASEAMEKIRRHKPDLVLMDIKMPGMDGVTAYVNMKDVYPDLRVILVTAYPEVDLISTALQEGAFGCFEKPLDQERLLCVIEDALAENAKVLVIDDDVDFGKSIEAVLMEKGYRITLSHHHDAALAEVRQRNFDLVLLDIKLGVQDGWKTYCALREIRPNMPVLAITGYGDEVSHLAQRITERENRPWMRKPLDIPAICLLLEELRKRDGEKG